MEKDTVHSVYIVLKMATVLNYSRSNINVLSLQFHRNIILLKE